MHQLASEELFGRQNVTLLLKDALRNKNHLDTGLLALLAERVAARPGAALKLVANLPYNVATPILGNLLECPTPPATMTVTIQKELAERITAAPGTKDYGALNDLDSEPMPHAVGAAVAAQRILAATESDVGHPAHRARRSHAGSDRRSRFLSRFRPRAVHAPAQIPAQRAGRRPQRDAGQSRGRRRPGRARSVARISGRTTRRRHDPTARPGGPSPSACGGQRSDGPGRFRRNENDPIPSRACACVRGACEG